MASLSTVIARFSQQTVVYWQKTGSDSHGKPTYANPVELKVRFEDKQQEVIMPDQRKVVSKGYYLTVNELVVGSIVYLGTLLTWQALPTWPRIPTMNQGGFEIALSKSITDLRGINVGFEAYVG